MKQTQSEKHKSKVVKEMAGTSIAQLSVSVSDVVQKAPVQDESHPQQSGLTQTMEWGSDTSDEQLMLACQRGREDALDELYSRYYRPMLGFIYRLVQDRQLAEDLVQETFLRVYNNRLSWKPKSKFTSWLYRIARNLCIDEKRRYWNRLVSMNSQFSDAQEESRESFLDRVEDSKSDARENCAREVDENMIRKAINELSEEQREVILLNKYQGLTYIEIADVLGVSPESVKQRAYRAHLKLRELLEPMLGEY
jgi:RNA polymerase sigma-70 factor (ECF subfamily)